MRKIPVISLLITALLPVACFDEISLDVPQVEETKLVIEGYVNKGDDHLDVYLLVGYRAALLESGPNVTPIPITRAYLTYNEVAFPDFELLNNQVTRLPLAPFKDQAPGEQTSFRLNVELPGGIGYQSSQEFLYPVPDAEEIDIGLYKRLVVNTLEQVEEKEFLEIKLTSPLSVEQREKSFLKWELVGVFRFIEKPPPPDNPFIDQNTCYVDHKLGNNEILIFNGRETVANRLERYPILKDVSISHVFSFGYYLTVFQQSLSPGAYQYWDRLRQNANLGGGLFDPTPGAVPGNIQNINTPSEQVLGYFYATQTDTIRRLIRPAEVNYPRIFCYDPVNEQLDRCVDCTTIRGSTLKKPDYWID